MAEWLWEVSRSTFSDSRTWLEKGEEELGGGKIPMATHWEIKRCLCVRSEPGPEFTGQRIYFRAKDTSQGAMPWDSLVSLCALPSRSRWNGPLKTQLQLCWLTTPCATCALLYKMWVWLNLCPVSGCGSSIASTQGSWNQVCVTHLTIIIKLLQQPLFPLCMFGIYWFKGV